MWRGTTKILWIRSQLLLSTWGTLKYTNSWTSLLEILVSWVWGMCGHLCYKLPKWFWCLVEVQPLTIAEYPWVDCLNGWPTAEWVNRPAWDSAAGGLSWNGVLYSNRSSLYGGFLAILGLCIWGLISAVIRKRGQFLTTSEDSFGIYQTEWYLGSGLCGAAGERRSEQRAAGPEISISA